MSKENFAGRTSVAREGYKKKKKKAKASVLEESGVCSNSSLRSSYPSQLKLRYIYVLVLLKILSRILAFHNVMLFNFIQGTEKKRVPVTEMGNHKKERLWEGAEFCKENSINVCIQAIKASFSLCFSFQ